MNVPFLDLKAHHQPHREEFRRVIDEVIDRGAFAGGPFVEAFETEFAAYCQTRFAAGVGSGTDALWLALKALGVGEGDEVITAPGTFFATAEAISLAGARPGHPVPANAPCTGACCWHRRWRWCWCCSAEV